MKWFCFDAVTAGPVSFRPAPITYRIRACVVSGHDQMGSRENVTRWIFVPSSHPNIPFSHGLQHLGILMIGKEKLAPVSLICPAPSGFHLGTFEKTVACPHRHWTNITQAQLLALQFLWVGDVTFEYTVSTCRCCPILNHDWSAARL